MKKISLCFFLILTLLWGCGTEAGQTGETTEPQSGETTQASALNNSELFSDRDYEVGYDETESVIITLSGSSASCDSSAVTISGGEITITAEGTYILRGTLENGSVTVDIDKKDKAQLVLDGASIHSEASAPLYIRQADKVFVTTAQGSENSLSNGGSFTPDGETNIDSVIFSKEDLTLNGAGSLTLSSPAGHGIVSKDELTMTSGTYFVTATSHGITGKDNVCIANCELTIEAGKDGIHSENNDDEALGFIYLESGSFHITAGNDGISAKSSLEILGGSFNLLCGGGSVNGETHTGGMGGFGGFGGHGGMGGNPFGGETATEETTESMKGIKCAGNISISGGSFTIDSADDSIHSNTNITISGGSFQLSSGDDGIHADESLTVTQGVISVDKCYEGLEALDVLVSGGDIKLYATDDGINAAGGTDSSGFGGNFGGGDNFGRPGGHGGGMGGMSAGNGSIVISGGNLYINASGDGIDANGSLEISGGFTTVCGPTRGDTATLDYDTTATISGGTFIGTGASGMAQSFSDSPQGVFAVSVGNQGAGTAITLTDASGKVLFSHTPELEFAVVILSCPEMVKGETYTITVGETTGSFAAK